MAKNSPDEGKSTKMVEKQTAILSTNYIHVCKQ